MRQVIISGASITLERVTKNTFKVHLDKLTADYPEIVEITKGGSITILLPPVIQEEEDEGNETKKSVSGTEL